MNDRTMQSLEDQRQMTQAEWIDNAEHDVRVAYWNGDDRSQLENLSDYGVDQSRKAEDLKRLRLDLHRLIKRLESGEADVLAVGSLANRLQFWIDDFTSLKARSDRAAEERIRAMVADERERRATPEAWQQRHDWIDRTEHSLGDPESRII